MAGPNVYDQIINGTFNALNPSVAEMYAGIYPPASSAPTPSYQPGMMGRGQPSSVGSPYLTAAEQQQLAQQIAASQALQGQGQTATASNSVPLPIPRPSYWPQTTAAALSPNATTDDLLAYAKSINKPGNPAAIAAANLGGNPPVTKATAAMQPPRRQGLFDLLFGGGGFGGSKSGGMGLLSLLPQAQPQAPRTLSYSKPGMTPSQSYNKTNQDAIARASAKIGGTGGSSSQSSSGSSSNNLGGVSSSGRRYDYDNNTWV